MATKRNAVVAFFNNEAVRLLKSGIANNSITQGNRSLKKQPVPNLNGANKYISDKAIKIMAHS